MATVDSRLFKPFGRYDSNLDNREVQITENVVISAINMGYVPQYFIQK